MKKIICLLLVSCVLFLMTGCQKARVLHCDGCGTEVNVKESSNMEEDWIIYCESCNEEFFGDDPILGNG